ncbi:MAG: hypothetical protein ACLTA5_03740 [Anaerococcus obesiensis]
MDIYWFFDNEYIMKALEENLTVVLKVIPMAICGTIGAVFMNIKLGLRRKPMWMQYMQKWKMTM